MKRNAKHHREHEDFCDELHREEVEYSAVAEGLDGLIGRLIPFLPSTNREHSEHRLWQRIELDESLCGSCCECDAVLWSEPVAEEVHPQQAKHKHKTAKDREENHDR